MLIVIVAKKETHSMCKLHCKNSGVVVTPNLGVSELCTSEPPLGCHDDTLT